jgi:hypothetical protein
MSQKDVLEEWGGYISDAEDYRIFTGGDDASHAGVALADCIIALAAEVRALRARVAELEPLAELGRLVVDMPIGICVSYGMVSFNYHMTKEGLLQTDHKTFHEFAKKWEAALEAARKEEP